MLDAYEALFVIELQAHKNTVVIIFIIDRRI